MKIVPDILKYQFEPEYAKTHNWSDKCCEYFKHGLLSVWESENGIKNTFTGMRQQEGGNRSNLACVTSGKNGKHFNILAPVTEEWEEWFIKTYHIELCELYYPPYNFKRTGCLGCPFNMNLGYELDNLKQIDEKTYKQANLLWQETYDEYRRINYRLKNEKPTIFDFMEDNQK